MADSKSQIARKELLIVLDYLLKFTDEKHLTRNNNIVEYAQKTYQTTIKQQRVTTILEFLYDVSSQYPDAFPFVLQYESTGVKKKYYIERRYFNDEEILQISSAIQNDRYTSPEESHELVNKFLENATNVNRISEFKQMNLLQQFNVAKLKGPLLKKVKQLQEAAERRATVFFTLPSSENVTTPTTETTQKSIIATMIKISEANHKPVAHLLDTQTHKVITYPVHKMTIQKIIPFYEKGQAPDINSQFKDDNYTRIEDFIADSIIPENHGFIADITFRFRYNDNDFDTVRESFTDYFKRRMVSKNTLVPLKLSAPLENGPAKTNNVTYTYVQVKANSVFFIKWATQYEIAALIEVMEPARLVKQLLYHYSRTIERLQKYDPSATVSPAKYVPLLSFQAKFVSPKEDFMQTIIENGILKSLPLRKHVQIPNGVKVIAGDKEDQDLKNHNFGRDIFYNCLNKNKILETVRMVNDVQIIGAKAFEHCHSLTSVVFSKQTQEIRLSAFLGCYLLKEVWLPKSVKRIDQWAFGLIKGLKVYYEGNEKEFQAIHKEIEWCEKDVQIKYNSPQQPLKTA